MIAKTLAEFQPSRKLSVLLLGQPKTGKTTVALQFPAPYIVDGEGNLGGPLAWLRSVGRFPEKAWVGSVLIDEQGQPVPPELRWNRFMALCQEAALLPEVETIVVDSLSAVNDFLVDAILARKAGSRDRDQMTIADWVPFRAALIRWLHQMRSTGRHFVVLAHELMEKDEALGYLVYKPWVQSRLQDHLGAYFSDVWVTMAENGKYWILTAPDQRRMQVGTSLQLPPRWTFQWDDIQRQLSPV